MKVNELMIGDWVKEDGFIQIIEDLSKIDGINGYGEDRYTPIPLTEEIIVKNGMTRHPSSPSIVMYSLTMGDKTFIGYEKPNLWVCYPSGCIKVYIKCEYVHEFQHILRLCGIDELANNFKV